MDEQLKLLLSLQVQALGQEALQGIADGLDSLAKHAGAVGPAVAAAGVALAAVGAVAVTALGEAVNAAAGWQTAMTQVANNTNMSNQAMGQMNDAILAMAQTTSAPLDQLAEGYMHVSNMGFQGADATKVLQAAMESAVSTGGNTADVANVLANVMHEFGMQATQAGQAIDVLHTAAALGNMTLEQMTNSFGPVAAIASTIGVPLDQASAAMAAITRHGFDAAEAGTQLKNMLEKIAAPTAGARTEMEQLAKTTGVDLTQDFSQAGLASKGLTGVLEDIARATNGNVDAFNQLTGGTQLTTDQLNQLAEASHGNIQAIQQLDPNIRGLYAMFILTGRGAGDYLDILRQIDASTQGAGITAESYARTQETLGFQMGVLKNNFEVAAIEIGDHFLPQITAAVEWVTGSAIPGMLALASALGGALAPALAAVGQIWQQVTAAFRGGGLLAALEALLGDLGGFAQAMFGAGWNLVATFAQGMIQAADSLITAVVNDIASIIGSFLIGNSPPPVGPLSRIDQGGANTMQAYLDGMQKQLSAGGLTAIAQQIGTQFAGMATGADFAALQGQIAQTTTLLGGLKDQAAGTAAQTKESAANIKAAQAALQAETSQVTTALNGINGQVQTNTDEQNILKGVIADITDSYKGQIDPLQQQLDLLKSQVDYAQQLRQAQESVRMAQLDQSILNDKGDPSKGAALQAQLQALQEQQRGLDLKSQIADLEAQKKQAAGNPDKLAALNLQGQELGIQQQIYALTNHQQLAADTAAKAQLSATMAAQAAAQKVAEAQQKAKEAAYEQQIASKKALEAAALAPYQGQLKTLQDQATVLNTQKQQWTDLKSQIQAASQQAQSMTSALGAAAGHLAAMGAPNLGGLQGGGGLQGAGGLKGIGGLPSAGAPAVDPTALASTYKTALDTAMQAGVASASQKAEDAAKAWIAGFEAKVRAELPLLMTRAFDQIKAAVAPLAGAAIGAVLGTVLGAALGGPVGAFLGGRLGTAVAAGFGALIGQELAVYVPRVLAGLGQILEQVGTWLSGTALPAIHGQLQVWAAEFGLWVTYALPPLLTNLGTLLGAFTGWVGGTALPAIVAAVGGWSAALAGWVAAAWPMLLERLGEFAQRLGAWIGEALPALASHLLQWGQAFVAWIVPAASRLRDNLGPMLDSLGGWIVDTAVPAIAAQLEQWGTAFVAWIAPAIPPLIVELVKLLTGLTVWVTFVALPTIVEKLLEWGVAFVQWVAPRIPEVLLELGKLLVSLTGWAITTAVPAMVQALFAVGTAIITGIMQGLAPLGQQLDSALRSAINSIHIDLGPFHLSASGFRVDSPPPVTVVTNEVHNIVDNVSGAVSSHLPARAAGGPVLAGQAYVVGEQRPELFIPDTNGMILPKVPGVSSGSLVAGRAGGSGGAAPIVINITGNYLMSSRDLEDLATKVGRVIVRQAGTGYSLAGLGAR